MLAKYITCENSDEGRNGMIMRTIYASIFFTYTGRYTTKKMDNFYADSATKCAI